MPWIKKTLEHYCDKPEFLHEEGCDIGKGSVWRCPTCGAEWVVRADNPNAPRHRKLVRADRG
ncbi:hypothetical protein [Saccharopolyspora mangrovi]|uniref:Uncharacterized protein n=1 Tax=Saccharopolyspora mangrovi TaxID=3082379 RepID=A0ABU6A786_9PSEU|nr:hypothetical protein [Saccharopolyspora sp. S2-29]MEB3367371.1 hypothetical protein [Saccharopolyspora sp. S2-29]